jgi:protease-4
MFQKIFNKKMSKNFLIGIGIAVILVAGLITIKDEFLFWISTDENTASQDLNKCADGGNVALIKIRGGIVNYSIDPKDDPNGIYYDPDSVSSDNVMREIEEAENNDAIKGIVVEIDSPGGIPVAGEEIMNSLLSLKMPTVAFIRERGLSAGYLVATAADKIYASRTSDVGSIGVTMSYMDYSKQNEKEGLTYNQLSTGKFKDMGDSDKELTAEEKSLLMSDLEKSHQIFVEYVAKNRNMDIEAVKKLADGSSMIAQDAIDAGLVDEIGGINEAKAYLENKLGEAVKMCEYAK